MKGYIFHSIIIRADKKNKETTVGGVGNQQLGLRAGFPLVSQGC